MRSRAPLPDDAPAVLAVLHARDAVDFGAPDFTLEDLRDQWDLSDFDLARDAVVVEDEDGRIVGYATVQRPGTLAVVEPDHERRGVGARLLRWAERRERELGRARHRQWVAASNASGRALLHAAGYEPERSYWRMVLALDQLDHVADAVGVPAGFVLRPLDVAGDAAELHALDDASFAANADYQPEPIEAFREEHLEPHDLEPELSLVAERDDRIAGFLLARRWRDEAVGFVDILAVHPDCQRRGLGSVLLLSAFRGFSAAGLREAQLGVASDNPRALRLYERVGMSVRFRVDTYQRPIM